MAAGTLTPTPWFTGLDNNGAPLVGGLLYVYAAGTLTPFTTYSDINLSVPNTNPIVLDGGGRATIYLPAATIKYVLNRADNSTVRTQDNVPATSIGQTAAGGEIFVFGGDPTSPSNATSYPTGALVTALHAGASILEIDSVTLIGTYALEAMLMADTGTVTVGLMNLTDGAPNTPLVEITSTSTTGQRVRSGTITFAAPGAAKDYSIKIHVSGGSGWCWGAKLIRTS